MRKFAICNYLARVNNFCFFKVDTFSKFAPAGDYTSTKVFVYILNKAQKKEPPPHPESGSFLLPPQGEGRGGGFSTPYKLSKPYFRRGLSSWYGRTGHAVCRYVRRCGRQNSRAGPATGWPADVRCGNRRNSTMPK